MPRVVCAAIVLALAAPARLGAEGADSWLGRDKALHFTVGTGAASGAYGLSALVFDGRDRRVTTGIAVSLAGSAGKEWYDRSRGGHASWRDFTWGAVGAATGVTIAWLIDRARHRKASRPPVGAVPQEPGPP